MIRITSLLFLIVLIGGYFWYVHGIEIGRAIDYISRIDISITVEEPETPAEAQDPARGIWEALPSMPTARTGVSTVTHNEKIFVIGGIDAFGRSRELVEVYDPEEKVWREGTPLPEKRHHATSISLGGDLYVLGGFSGLNFTPTQEAWRYDSDDDTWHEIPHIPHTIGGAAGVGLMYGTDLTNGKTLLLFGGISEEGTSAEVMIFDVEQQEWRKGTPMRTARAHLGATYINGKVYVIGGRDKSLTKNKDDLEVYYPEKDIWAIGPAMPMPRSNFASAALDGMIYVFGGEEPLSTLKNTARYDPVTKTWESLNDMQFGRQGVGAAVYDGAIYVIGGGKRPLISVSNINEVFTPPVD